jgi:hypothetical protein
MGVTLLGGVVMYGGWIAVNGVPGVEEARQQTLVEAREQTRPTETVDAQARERDLEEESEASAAAEPKRIARTVPQVLRTSFVPEYRDAQPAIAGPQFRKTYHPDEDLASDGLHICTMIEDPGITLTDMIEDFTNFDHPHKGPVTPKAAMETYRLALRTLCPDLTGEFEEKRP